MDTQPLECNVTFFQNLDSDYGIMYTSLTIL